MASKELDSAAILSRLLSREPESATRFVTALIAALSQDGVSQETIRHAMTTALLTVISSEMTGENPEAGQRALAILEEAKSLVDQLASDEPAHH